MMDFQAARYLVEGVFMHPPAGNDHPDQHADGR